MRTVSVCHNLAVATDPVASHDTISKSIPSPHVGDHGSQLLVVWPSVLSLHADLEHLDLILPIRYDAMASPGELTGEAKMALAAPAMLPAKATCGIDRLGYGETTLRDMP